MSDKSDRQFVLETVRQFQELVDFVAANSDKPDNNNALHAIAEKVEDLLSTLLSDYEYRVLSNTRLLPVLNRIIAQALMNQQCQKPFP